MAGAHERVIASRRTWWRGRAPWRRMTGASTGAATWRRSIYRRRPSSSLHDVAALARVVATLYRVLVPGSRFVASIEDIEEWRPTAAPL